ADDYQFFRQLPDQVRLELARTGWEQVQAQKMVSVKNGKKRWQKINDREPVEGPGSEEEALQFLGPRGVLRLKDPEMKLTWLGERMAGDRDALPGGRGAL